METFRRIFDESAHARFIRLSRDSNPIHADPVAARRMQTGAPIVHGIHSLLWLLECIAQSGVKLPTATDLKVLFRRVIYLGEQTSAQITEASSKAIHARLVVEGTEAVAIVLGFDGRQGLPRPALLDADTVPMSPPSVPNNLRLEEMNRCQGCLAFTAAAEQTAEMFPVATRYLGHQRVGALVCSSCLVGMVLPGLHSFFGGLDLCFTDDDSPAEDLLQFAVLSVEPRLRFVRIGIRGRGFHGALDTASRTLLVTQPSVARVRKLVANDEFRTSTTLVIGGSRGLGEVTAKILAAGGARVMITYASGSADANAVASEIRSAGSQCDLFTYDVRQSASDQLAALDLRALTHLYYFATPAISRRKTGFYDLRRLAEFNTFYVTGFLDVVQTCLHRNGGRSLGVFFPSSVAVDVRPADLTEYAMAKAAAEMLCADMGRFLPNVRALTCRLPRLATDQTNSLLQVQAADPVETILPIVREMHRQ